MISIKEAHDIINSSIPNSKIERVAFNHSSGRILAKDVFSSFDQPLFNNSAMDGFAIRSADIKNATKESPIKLSSIATIAAGNDISNISISRGLCAQIMTGAPIPRGADTVVIVEKTSGFENVEVSFFESAKYGQNIRKIGEEIVSGTKLINSGTTIGPSEIGMFAVFGYSDIAVYKRPKVSIFGLGDELREPGDKLLSGQIYNSNLYLLKELVQLSGGEIILSQLISDKQDAMESFMCEALKESDIIISSGGISMGKFDFVKPVMQSLGVKEKFWKVLQKPGKPLFFGTQAHRMVFGLPGNPISSYICFMEYIYPCIQKFQHANMHHKILAKLTESFPVESKKHRFLFGEYEIDNEKLFCTPSKKYGSHMFSSSLGANCIIESPPGDRSKVKGDMITINPIPWEKIK